MRIVDLALIVLLPSVALQAQVDLEPDAVIYFGSPSNTTAPATIDVGKVRQATREWRKIQVLRIRPGSARYRLLVSAMERRIRSATKQAVRSAGCDFVARSGDIRDARGKQVTDLTSLVIQNL